MAAKDFLVDINLNKQRLLNAALQIVPTFPSDPVVGQVLWNSAGSGGAFVWSGTSWIDLGEVYTHPTYAGAAQPAAEATGATMISQITLTNGHVTGVKTRTLTAAQIGAAETNHTHAFNEIIGVPQNTILGNNGAAGPAKALTVAELLSMLGVAYGTRALLNTGTDAAQRTFSAKDLSEWVTSRLSTYLTAVNLTLGVRTATTQEIVNSAGSNVTLPAVLPTGAGAGLMTTADKAKLDGVAANANNYVHPTTNPGASHPFATAVSSGVKVLSQMIVNTEGHVTGISARDLTATDLAAVMITANVNDILKTDQTWSAKVINDKLQQAIVDVTSGALVYKGPYNPSTNVPNIKVTTPVGTIKAGFTYVVSVAGTFIGEDVEPGDMIIAKVDNPGATLANYQLVNKNIPAIVAATEIAAGIIKLASVSEAIDGVENTKAITSFTLKAAMDARVGGATSTFGNGSALTFTINHTLNTKYVIAQFRNVATGREVIVDWAATAVDTIVVNLNVAPANNELEVVIKK